MRHESLVSNKLIRVKLPPKKAVFVVFSLNQCLNPAFTKDNKELKKQ